jgi:hypothetical protein
MKLVFADEIKSTHPPSEADFIIEDDLFHQTGWI